MDDRFDARELQLLKEVLEAYLDDAAQWGEKRVPNALEQSIWSKLARMTGEDE